MQTWLSFARRWTTKRRRERRRLLPRDGLPSLNQIAGFRMVFVTSDMPLASTVSAEGSRLSFPTCFIHSRWQFLHFGCRNLRLCRHLFHISSDRELVSANPSRPNSHHHHHYLIPPVWSTEAKRFLTPASLTGRSTFLFLSKKGPQLRRDSAAFGCRLSFFFVFFLF